MARRITDWEMIERDYRVGVLSVQMLAEKYSVDKVTIHRRAKKYAWTRDLSVQVQAATKAKVNALVIADATGMQLQRNSIDAFEVNSQAEINATIIRKHQKDSGKQGILMNMMMNMLEDAAQDTESVNALLDKLKVDDPLAWKSMVKVMSRGSYIDDLKKLIEMQATHIKNERVAFNIDVEEKKTNSTIDDLIKNIEAQPDYGNDAE